MRVRPELCVGAVVVEAGNLLLIRRARGFGIGRWSVPGGRVEAGETVERIHDDHHFVILDFVVDVLDPVEPVAGDDASEARWVPLEEVAELDLVDGLAEFLHEHGVLDTIV
jgi:8-oxo-dGTP diphosphatase